MTRGSWAGVMVLSLLITLASGYYLVSALGEKETIDLPLKQVKHEPAPPPLKEPPPEPEKSAKLEKEEPSLSAQTEQAPPRLRNILFTYHSSSAKKVFFISDANEWNRIPMKKKSSRTWTLAQKLPPGQVKYMFIVDERRITDPNNKRLSNDGKSILIVKPLPKK